jgi:hypothetical protein
VIDDEEDGGDDEEEDEDASLRKAPSVEFTVRNRILRDKIVDELIEEIMESLFCEDPEQRKWGKPLAKAMQVGIIPIR